MSAADPGAASGQQVYVPMKRCTCRDLVTLHKPHDVTKARGACSNSNCNCRKFTEEALCLRCKVTPSAGTCCSSHDKLLCHGCYRRTHFVEVCVEGCAACDREGLSTGAPTTAKEDHS